MRILVTGGAGFIGSTVVRHILENTPHELCNVDKLTYASDPRLASLDHPRYTFVQHDICDAERIDALLDEWQADAVMHLAAESHVDRSIEGPAEFLRTNILGTFTLLQSALAYWVGLDDERKDRFRFHHISTDEVYGDLEPDEAPFVEMTPYRPSSPYSASKASSDHLVRAWHRTYGLPVLITNCSNNYGPRQFPEKLIPLMISRALQGRPLPVYGDGRQVRDWLHVEDHAEALYRVMCDGRVGETYNIGGLTEQSNIDVVHKICALLEELHPHKPASVATYADLIAHVTDRPGHDRRYAIDCTKIERELGWRPRHSFDSGLRQTVSWYLANRDWSDEIESSRYAGERIGLSSEPRAGAA